VLRLAPIAAGKKFFDGELWENPLHLRDKRRRIQRRAIGALARKGQRQLVAGARAGDVTEITLAGNLVKSVCAERAVLPCQLSRSESVKITARRARRGNVSLRPITRANFSGGLRARSIAPMSTSSSAGGITPTVRSPGRLPGLAASRAATAVHAERRARGCRARHSSAPKLSNGCGLRT